MDFDWKTLVKTVAPGIASVFGTPLAGMGVSALLNALLPEGEAKPANPEQFLAQQLGMANPEMLLKIKTAEQAFTLDLKRLDIDLKKFLEENVTKDIASARDLKKSWLTSGKFDYEVYLAALVVLMVIYAEGWVFYYAGKEGHTMEPNQAILVGRMLGTVEAAFMMLLTFRWGRSVNSDREKEIAAGEAMHKEELKAKAS